MRTLIIGTGRVATGIGLRLKEAGWEVSWASRRGVGPCGTVLSLEELKGEWDLVLLYVPDREIRRVGELLEHKGLINEGVVVGHASGALTSEVLPWVAKGRFSAHPPIAFPPAQGCHPVPEGVIYTAEGDEEGIRYAKRLVEALDGQLAVLRPPDKVLYHAASVIAANFAFLDLMIAEELFERIGHPYAWKVAKGLVQSVIGLKGWKEATGPAARGDAEVIKAHLEALKGVDPSVADYYITAISLMIERLCSARVLGEEECLEVTRLLKDG